MANVTGSSDISDAASKIESYVVSLPRQVSSFIEETHSNTGIVEWALETIREVLSQIKGKKKWWLASSEGSVKSKSEGCTNR